MSTVLRGLPGLVDRLRGLRDELDDAFDPEAADALDLFASLAADVAEKRRDPAMRQTVKESLLREASYGHTPEDHDVRCGCDRCPHCGEVI